MAKSRKKVFPKPPVPFHSKLAKDLGKWSNKVHPEATHKALYDKMKSASNNIPKVTETQQKQLDTLKATLAKRNV